MIFDIEIDFENYTTRITIWFSKEHREREIDDLSSTYYYEHPWI